MHTKHWEIICCGAWGYATDIYPIQPSAQSLSKCSLVLPALSTTQDLRGTKFLNFTTSAIFLFNVLRKSLIDELQTAVLQLILSTQHPGLQICYGAT